MRDTSKYRFRNWASGSLLLLLLASCSTNSFWSHIVEDRVSKPMHQRQTGEVDLQPRQLSPHNVKVVYSNGSTATEVLIPILSSGQQIIIDHKERRAPQSLSLVPMPPAPADKSIIDAYVESGGSIDHNAAAVSIVKTHEKIMELVRSGNYGLALEHAELIFARYSAHPKTLRIKGSLLLKLGERDAALKTYYLAQELDPDPLVEEQIQKLEKALDNR